MKSKELIQAHISFLEQNMKHDSILKPSLINDDMLEIELYKKVLKDLEEKELLEIELKLEKDKVKYVMGQLEKQDKILHIFKNNIKLVDYKGNGSTQAYKIIIEDKFTVEEENDMTYRNLDFDAIKEWSNGK